jgi:hypothetical protein
MPRDLLRRPRLDLRVQEEPIFTKPYYHLTYLAVGQTAWGNDNSQFFEEKQKEEALKVFHDMEISMRFPVLVHVDRNRGRTEVKRQFRNKDTLGLFDIIYSEGRVLA